MSHRLRTLVLTLTLLGLCPASRAVAQETEVRDFAIEIEGKNAGQLILTITKQDSGILSVKSQATTTFKHLFGTYRYTFQGVEHWKDGRLVQLSSKCDDDGKKTEVSGTAQSELLQLKVNGRERNCRGDVWTTTYWMMADARFHNAQVPLLDADTGKEFVGQLKYVGVEKLMVGGKQQDCHHFQVTGGPTTPCDLWFDGLHRLVRQEFTDQGKRVLFNLTTLRRQN